MEGLSTKRAKKIKRKEPEWTALVTIDSVVPSRIPELVLCGELGSIPMKISSEPVPGAKVLKYHQVYHFPTFF
jgi:uncharacterized membrane protein